MIEKWSGEGLASKKVDNDGLVYYFFAFSALVLNKRADSEDQPKQQNLPRLYA
jgi:hypothetical protein